MSYSSFVSFMKKEYKRIDSGQLSISDVPVQFRTINVGMEWGVTECPECRYDTSLVFSRNIVGFGEIAGEVVASVECPKCFTRFFIMRLWKI